mgnify:CR=1 FL=1
MFVSTEVENPDPRVTRLIEDIVRNQVIEMIIQSRRMAQRRLSKYFTPEDLIFLIRYDKAKVNRLRTYLSWKDVRKNAKDTNDASAGGSAGPAQEGDGIEEGGDIFNMAQLGFRIAQRSNGVAKLHGAVSRGMFQDLYPGFDVSEVPIGSVTNGVHHGTWADRLVAERATDPLSMPDDALWRLLATLPTRMRTVLVLRYFEDMDDAAIAQTLGRSAIGAGAREHHGDVPPDGAGPEDADAHRTHGGHSRHDGSSRSSWRTG